MLGISACLLGIPCRYDGKGNEVARVKELAETESTIKICPEVMGGLSTPRKPAEIVGGDGFDVWSGNAKVLANDGEDVTEQFKEGAKRTLELLQKNNVTEVVLKEKSPSCGSCLIYDGTFSRSLIDGIGVSAALFELNDIVVYSENSAVDFKRNE